MNKSAREYPNSQTSSKWHMLVTGVDRSKANQRRAVLVLPNQRTVRKPANESLVTFRAISAFPKPNNEKIPISCGTGPRAFITEAKFLNNLQNVAVAKLQQKTHFK